MRENPSTVEQSDILNLIETFKSQLSQSFKEDLDDSERFKNPYARAFETSMAVTLFENPTQEMMQSLHRVSKKILGNMNQSSLALLAYDIERHRRHSGCFAFGIGKSFRTIDAEIIKTVLSENNPENFGFICLIHFHFARDAYRYYSSQIDFRSTLGEFSDEYRALTPFQDEPPEAYLSRGISKIRAVSDKHMYHTQYYQDRGRGAQIMIDPSETRHLGVISQSGVHQASDQPFLESTEHQFGAWEADVAYQTPDYATTYVSNALNHEYVYVAGPSGMTSMMLGLAFAVGPDTKRPSDLQDLRAYLLCIMSYIVSGGYHSIHEVLGPADHCLGLLDNRYHPADQGPNFSLIFEAITTLAVNPHLKERIWERYLNYISRHYIQDYETHLIPEAISDPEVSENAALLQADSTETSEATSFLSKHKKSIITGTLSL